MNMPVVVVTSHLEGISTLFSYSSEDEDDDVSLPQRKMKREMEKEGMPTFLSCH
jgi:hypothetical protein